MDCAIFSFMHVACGFAFSFSLLVTTSFFQVDFFCTAQYYDNKRILIAMFFVVVFFAGYPDKVDEGLQGFGL